MPTFSGTPASSGVGTILRGGEVHARLIKEACLMIAEEMENNLHGSRNPHYQSFMEALVASVGHDRMLESPDSLGRDRRLGERLPTSDHYGNYHEFDDNIVTINGQTY